MGSVSIPIITAFSDSLAGLGGALGLGAVADAGSAFAGATAAGAAGVGGADAATAAALSTIAGQSATEGGILAAAAPGLDAAATGAGLSAADIGGSFSSLAAMPVADFLGGATGAGVPGSTTAAAPLSSPGAAVTTPSATGAVAGGGAPTGSAAAGAAPASAAASPTTTGVLGSVDPSLIETASAPAGLTGDTAASTLGASTAPAGLTGAAPTAAATAAGATPAATGAGLLGTLKSYAPLLASGGGLLTSMLEGNKNPAFEGQLQSQAAQMASQSAQLESYLTSGTLPPGVSAGLSSAHDAAAATIRSQYAARGQTGSSAEMQDLANLEATTVSQGAQIATNLLQQGVSESQFSAQLYEQLMQASMQQDAALSKSIADFSGSLAGMGLKSVG